MRPSVDGGFATPQFMLAAGLSLVFFVLLANFVVFQYGRGVVRGALDEGVRAAAPAGAGEADCLRAFDAMAGNLLGGPLGEEVTRSCTVVGELVEARATVTFRGWLPLVPDWTFSLAASRVKEAAP